MLTCKKTTRLLSDAQDRPLDNKERLGLGIHLLFCSGCRQYEKQIQLLRKLIRSKG